MEIIEQQPVQKQQPEPAQNQQLQQLQNQQPQQQQPQLPKQEPENRPKQSPYSENQPVQKFYAQFQKEFFIKFQIELSDILDKTVQKCQEELFNYEWLAKKMTEDYCKRLRNNLHKEQGKVVKKVQSFWKKNFKPKDLKETRLQEQQQQLQMGQNAQKGLKPLGGGGQLEIMGKPIKQVAKEKLVQNKEIQTGEQMMISKSEILPKIKQSRENQKEKGGKNPQQNHHVQVEIDLTKKQVRKPQNAPFSLLNANQAKSNLENKVESHKSKVNPQPLVTDQQISMAKSQFLQEKNELLSQQLVKELLLMEIKYKKKMDEKYKVQKLKNILEKQRKKDMTMKNCLMKASEKNDEIQGILEKIMSGVVSQMENGGQGENEMGQK